MSGDEPGALPDLGESTLEQVEGDRWVDAPADSTELIRRCHELRRRPLRDLQVEDLRLLLGQLIGAPVLVPLALPILSGDPMAEGDLYPGDLLAAVLRQDPAYWNAHPDQAARLTQIVAGIDAGYGERDDTELPALIASFIERARRSQQGESLLVEGAVRDPERE